MATGSLPGEHTWFVFEAKKHRIEKSLSDLGGTDVYIHRGSADGLFGELTNAFVRARRQPSGQMKIVFAELRAALPKLMRDAGTRSPFTARVFDDLRLLARSLSDRYVP